MTSRVLIDLNVVTIGSWEKPDPRRKVAEEFMRLAGEQRFYVVTPYALLERVGKWHHKELVSLIKDFYAKVTDEYVEKAEVFEELFENFEAIYDALIKVGVKGEDAFLVMVCAVKKAALVTFDKKHLKNKGAEIGKVLAEHRCANVEILLPEEAVQKFGLNAQFSSSFSEFPVVPKNLFTHSFFDFCSKLNRVGAFRNHVFGFASLVLFAFHALNSYFFIYKPFGEFVDGSKEVLWESSAA